MIVFCLIDNLKVQKRYVSLDFWVKLRFFLFLSEMILKIERAHEDLKQTIYFYVAL